MQPFHIPKAFSVAPGERSRYLLPAITVTFGIAIWLLTRASGIDSSGKRWQGIGVVDFLLKHQSEPAIVYVVAVCVAMLVIFTIGHILDLSSQFILERLFADKLGGFPHERIVPIGATTPRYELFQKRKRAKFGRTITFYEGTKAALAATSLLVLCQILFRAPNVHANPDAAFVLLAASYYWSSAILAGIISMIPALLVGYTPGSSPIDSFRRIERFFQGIRERSKTSIVAEAAIAPHRLLFGILLIPATYIFDSVDRFVRAAFRLNTEIDSDTFENFKAVFRRRFEIDFLSIGNNDRFWLPYLALIHSKSDVLRPIVELRSIANFCRNQSLALFITSIVLASSYNLDQKSISEFVTKTDTYNISLLFFVLSWVFYWKFLQTYYAFSKMTFRAFAILPTAKITREIGQPAEMIQAKPAKVQRRSKTVQPDAQP